jgi:hypothetical protein
VIGTVLEDKRLKEEELHQEQKLRAELESAIQE